MSSSASPQKRGNSDLSRLSSTQNLALGMMAGVCTKAINYPLLTWKNASQQGLPISFNPKIVYRGTPMAMLNLGGTTAVQFGFTGGFKKLLMASSDLKGSSLAMSSALLGGVCSGLPCSVWELTMIQQQRFGGTLIGTPVRIAKDHGAFRLTRGMITCCGREGLYTMAMLGLTPTIQSELQQRYGLQSETALLMGAFSGSVFAATLTHPLDTIKTCMQGDVAGEKYTNIRNSAKTLTTEYGVARGLFKGLAWRISLITTTFFLVNQFKQVLAPMMFSPENSEPDS